MEQKNQYVAAIDIGTTKIVAIIGRKNPDGKIEVLASGKTASTGVKRGVVLNIEETANAIQQAVQEAEKIANTKFVDVYVGIAGQHIKSIRNRGYKNIKSKDPEITKQDVEDLKRDMYSLPLDPGEEIIHVIPQSYVVDNETGVKQPVGMHGRRLEANFHVVIGRVASAKNIKKCVSRTGLNVKGLVLEPLASSDAVLTSDEKEVGVALVDIGGGTTDIAVYYDGIIRHTAVIPFGGNVVTKDIKEGCSILLRHAEMLKVQYGSAMADFVDENKVVTIPGIGGRDSKQISFKSLAYIIQARVEEIIDAVRFEIENSGLMEKLGAGIVLTGGGSLLKHLSSLMKYHTGLDVRVGYPREHVAANTNSDLLEPMFSTSIGLLLKGAADLEKTADADKESEEIFGQEDDNENEQNSNNTEEAAAEEHLKEKRQKGGFFSTVRRTLLDIFEETDTRM